MVVVAAVLARGRGWVPSGHFTLGAWGWPVTILGLVFEAGAVINIIWPRPATPDASFYTTYLIPIVLAAVLVLGLLQLGRAAFAAGRQ
jgi:hypothetical protein